MAENHFSILGANGFIGSNLAVSLRKSGHDVRTYGRDDWPKRETDLGHAVFCLGLTGARANAHPAEALEAHAGCLADVLRHHQFKSLLYLSSTRLYLHSTDTHEDAPISCVPSDPGDLFNATKIAAEATCLAEQNSAVRVVRLSNVFGKTYGTDTFITDVIRAALTSGHIHLRSSRTSAKDYIDIRNVCDLLPRIAQDGKHRLYNVATGFNTEQGPIVDTIAQLTGCSVDVEADAPTITFPPIDVSRLRGEFALTGVGIQNRLSDLVEGYRKGLEGQIAS